MRKSDWAWLAGLFEGEGSVKDNNSWNPNAHSVVISITSTDFDVIERIHSLTGVGKVVFRKRANAKHPKWKPVKTWRVGARDDVIFILEGIGPWLLSRRGKRVDEALDRVRQVRDYVFQDST